MDHISPYMTNEKIFATTHCQKRRISKKHCQKKELLPDTGHGFFPFRPALHTLHIPLNINMNMNNILHLPWIFHYY
jgi:hypothetical protein